MEQIPDDPGLPRAPSDPSVVDLTDEQVGEFQRLVKQETGEVLTFEQAKWRATEMIRLYRMLMDPDGYEARLREWIQWQPPVRRLATRPPPPKLPPPDPEPDPRPHPIRRDADHAKEVQFHWAMVEDELRTVSRWPNNWRYVIVALYEALGHALALHCPPEKWPEEGLGQLTKLFDVVSSLRPDLRPVRESVGWVDRIRTSYLTYSVQRWPVGFQQLGEFIAECQGVIERATRP